jgi:hypothetical protein
MMVVRGPLERTYKFMEASEEMASYEGHLKILHSGRKRLIKLTDMENKERSEEKWADLQEDFHFNK